MKGADGFDQFYSDLYESRWPALREALLGGGNAISLSVGSRPPYYLDPASLVPALALDVHPEQRVADLCAAPGGKTLVLAAQLAGAGRLDANDRSSARRNRLHRVLAEHLPESVRRPVEVSGHDASRWGLYHAGAYDRVLADVPCSSEQHVLQSPPALEKWSSSRTRRLAQSAYAIACAAADSLRPGGLMVYSTCALSPAENDGVINRLLDRGAGVLAVERSNAVDAVRQILHAAHPAETDASIQVSADQELTIAGEQTEFGEHILPDTSGGGPIYYAVIRRTACNSA